MTPEGIKWGLIFLFTVNAVKSDFTWLPKPVEAGGKPGKVGTIGVVVWYSVHPIY